MSKILAFLIFCFALTSAVYAQNAQTKTNELIAALAKTKYKKKENRYVSIEIYVDVKSEAVVKSNISDYAGVYQSDDNYRLELRITNDGKIEGNGFDSFSSDFARRNFTLRDARIEGALMTATKVYETGETGNFEAVFNNRIITTGKNPNKIERRQTIYGLGFIQTSATWTNRVFLEFK